MTRTELMGKSLARSLVGLKPAAMRALAAELAKSRKGFLEDLADVIASLRRSRESRRNYRQFWTDLRKSRTT